VSDEDSAGGATILEAAEVAAPQRACSRDRQRPKGRTWHSDSMPSVDAR
jgi:hypothetical protein